MVVEAKLRSPIHSTFDALVVLPQPVGGRKCFSWFLFWLIKMCLGLVKTRPAIAPLTYVQDVLSHGTASTRCTAVAQYILFRYTYLSHSTPLFCGTATGSAMRSMSSHAVLPLQLVPTLAQCVLSRDISSRPTPPPAIAPLAYAQDVLSHGTASTRSTTVAQYILSRYTHLSRSTPLFCGTATGSAMRSMSSHAVPPLQLVSTLARCFLSRDISSPPPPPPPHTTPPPTSCLLSLLQ